MDRRTLAECTARLKALRDSLPTGNVHEVEGSLGHDYEDIRLALKAELDGDDLGRYALPDGTIFEAHLTGIEYCRLQTLRSKVNQLLTWIGEVSKEVEGEKIVDIRILVRSIEDAELRSRCIDLLAASSNFDRVINQATQVLEARIRAKAGADPSLVGVKLMLHVAPPEVARAKLCFSTDAAEHEGISYLLRGVMQAFRNPSHHKLTDSWSREQALKLCAFIDDLLALVEAAEVRP